MFLISLGREITRDLHRSRSTSLPQSSCFLHIWFWLPWHTLNTSSWAVKRTLPLHSLNSHSVLSLMCKQTLFCPRGLGSPPQSPTGPIHKTLLGIHRLSGLKQRSRATCVHTSGYFLSRNTLHWDYHQMGKTPTFTLKTASPEDHYTGCLLKKMKPFI